MTDSRIIQVSIPAPVYDTYDYCLPDTIQADSLRPGMRVQVPFGRRRLVGVIMRTSTKSRIQRTKLKPIIEIIDDQPPINPQLMELLTWASDYYQHPLGEVISSALPKRLRAGHKLVIQGTLLWRLGDRGSELALDALRRAPRQLSLLQVLRQYPEGVDTQLLNTLGFSWRAAMQALVKKGMVEKNYRSCLLNSPITPDHAPLLNVYQDQAVKRIISGLDSFIPYLLDGVTGSGKTEVYLHIVKHIIQKNQQALIIVPEIGLTPQLVERFRNRIDTPLVVMHSALSDSERHCAWYNAFTGHAQIIIGTRSAVFTPLTKPGVIIVDEEHDLSYKQQEGFHYHARDLAVFRARQYGIPIILGSATPSLESIYNVVKEKYARISLPQRAGIATRPSVELVDLRYTETCEGLSPPLLAEIQRHLDAGGQVLLFLNRRGYSPVLFCPVCTWVANCQRCDAHMTYHASQNTLLCHHCESKQQLWKSCPDCGSEKLLLLGHGTEKIEQELTRRFGKSVVLRIDRDTTKRRGAIQSKLQSVRRGEHRILVGTQMLSKGHDFPDLTLVGILNVDQGLYSGDFRAMEHLAQLIVQVSGRAGRSQREGKVMLQTHQPDHPLLNLLVEGGYEAFAERCLQERSTAGLPPVSRMLVLRAETPRANLAMDFLSQAKQSIPDNCNQSIDVIGPMPAPMERRSGKYRAQLIMLARQRKLLSQVLRDWVPRLMKLRSSARVRWSVDVDPMDMT